MDVVKWIRNQWDRSIAVAAFVVGAASLLIGWVGASSTPFPAEQLPYMLSGGLGGIFLLGLGAAFWLSADLRDEWRKLDELQALLDRIAPDEDAALHENGGDVRLRTEGKVRSNGSRSSGARAGSGAP